MLASPFPLCGILTVEFPVLVILFIDVGSVVKSCMRTPSLKIVSWLRWWLPRYFLFFLSIWFELTGCSDEATHVSYPNGSLL